jgi:hypothetical protein
MSKRLGYSVEAPNDFTEGWLAYVLGVPFAMGWDKPAAWADGWKMGEETPSLRPTRYCFEAPNDALPYIVRPLAELGSSDVNH